ncbi:wax ester/triacylglycerol synthase domain-containing protein [Qaidamihabitans albus]|uniref:wax ester/triacylglycerol synthase domain-containing protein n=1 Tax=Qaidamihabitans albus TaxID=2795733 RepID=UPI0027DB2DD3|nr:wax ester/triacylglycerol synthase domain-containing protein [Qaidamihabitans albus]
MVTTTDSSGPTGPRRILIVSADMGEGHNATGRALEAAARAQWPDVDVRWVDVLDAMGKGTGPLFRWIYATSVERLPRLYDFFYSSVWRYRWFARAAKLFIGVWTGRRLAPAIDDLRPDLVLSTYPMASTGLEWLRRHRGLTVPTGAWVSDFAPHPSWVHADLDLNLVMHEVAVRPARDAVPGAPVAVSAPPVPPAFAPGDRRAARDRLGLPAAGLLAVVSCGSLGFGRGEDTVRELLDGGPDIHVVVVAGRNERLRHDLEARFRGDVRVRVLGWVDDMAALMTAADVVVTNAGGATSLEALACGRAVLMHKPIAGHGRANAELMAEAGLARVCAAPGELAGVIREFRAEPDRLRELEEAASAHAGAHRLADGLCHLAATADARRERPLPASDALFLHVETPEAPQHVGTVLLFEPGPQALSPKHAGELLAGVPGLDGTLRGPGPLRRARWTPLPATDPRSLVDEVALGKATGPDGLTGAVDEFFSSALDLTRAAGAARLVTGLPDGRAALLVKLHHALGDGVTVLQALLADTDGAAGRSWSSTPASAVSGGPFPAPRRLLRGLRRLATAGRAPASPLDGRAPGPGRHHELVRLRGRQVRQAASALGVTPAELLQTAFAEALRRTLGPGAPSRFRLMVPWSLRGTTRLRAAGNHTGAVSVDLPLGPMPARERAALIAASVREQTGSAVPEAAHTVVRVLGWLPPPLHAAAARAVYRRAWFNAVGTVLPGPRREVRWHGARLAEAYPLLALAPGTGLAWGAMTWGEWITVCLTGTTGHAHVVRGLASALPGTLTELAQEVGP